MGTPKSSILIGCSIINHPFLGTLHCRKPPNGRGPWYCDESQPPGWRVRRLSFLRLSLRPQIHISVYLYIHMYIYTLNLVLICTINCFFLMKDSITSKSHPGMFAWRNSMDILWLRLWAVQATDQCFLDVASYEKWWMLLWEENYDDMSMVEMNWTDKWHHDSEHHPAKPEVCHLYHLAVGDPNSISLGGPLHAGTPGSVENRLMAPWVTRRCRRECWNLEVASSSRCTGPAAEAADGASVPWRFPQWKWG